MPRKQEAKFEPSAADGPWVDGSWLAQPSAPIYMEVSHGEDAVAVLADRGLRRQTAKCVRRVESSWSAGGPGRCLEQG